MPADGLANTKMLFGSLSHLRYPAVTLGPGPARLGLAGPKVLHPAASNSDFKNPVCNICSAVKLAAANSEAARNRTCSRVYWLLYPINPAPLPNQPGSFTQSTRLFYPISPALLPNQPGSFKPIKPAPLPNQPGSFTQSSRQPYCGTDSSGTGQSKVVELHSGGLRGGGIKIKGAARGGLGLHSKMTAMRKDGRAGKPKGLSEALPTDLDSEQLEP